MMVSTTLLKFGKCYDLFVIIMIYHLNLVLI